jgi:hypothetical protein
MKKHRLLLVIEECDEDKEFQGQEIGTPLMEFCGERSFDFACALKDQIVEFLDEK